MGDSPMIPNMDWSSAAREFAEDQEQRLIRQVFACYICIRKDPTTPPPAVVVMVSGTTYCQDHSVPGGYE